MSPPTAPKPTALTSAPDLTRSLEDLATKKIWLPKLLYDSLPYFYLFAGLASFFAGLYVNAWFWVLPHYILFAAACIHLGGAVYLKRCRYRARNESEEAATLDLPAPMIKDCRLRTPGEDHER